MNACITCRLTGIDRHTCLKNNKKINFILKVLKIFFLQQYAQVCILLAEVTNKNNKSPRDRSLFGFLDARCHAAVHFLNLLYRIRRMI